MTVEQELGVLRKKAERKLRKKLVFSDGVPGKIMLIGEAPGRKEEEQGIPFVGSAGRNLNKALEKGGIERKNVYITNIVLWRPPNNRKPTKKEVEKCKPFLIEQLRLIQPEIICTLGNTPLDFFSKGKKITAVHGKIIEPSMEGMKLQILPTFHPAAILYNRKLQTLFEKDIAKLKKYL